MDDPANRWFYDTVSALVYSFACQHSSPGLALLQTPYNDLTQFVLGQHAHMPDYLRSAMLAATLAFDCAGCVNSGRLFHSNPPSMRSRQIAAWKRSRLGFQRDLLRYHESLATFALYSRLTQNQTANQCGPGFAGQPQSGLIIDQPSTEMRCEVAVIGSGPGGAITACLLAEAGRNVLLIEEGPLLELESCTPFSREEMLQKYRNGGQTVALGRNKIAYVEGRCVGGGSEINSGLYHRTPPDILEQWRKEFQVENLGEEEMRPHFEACESALSVSVGPERAGASMKLEAGARQLGWKSLEVPRWVRYATDQPGGSRQSMTKTFVPRFVQARGQLLANTRVERLTREGSHWELHATHRSARLRIAAETVFVCAGAVQTPALLRRSGIGENIGKSLRVHPTIKAVARFSEALNSEGMGVPAHQVKEFAPRLSFGCSVSTAPYLALALLDYPQVADEVSNRWRQMAAYYAMITGQGAGTVRPIGRFRDPLVRYQITDQDRRDLADGLRKLAEMLLEAGAVAVYPGFTGGKPLQSRDDLKHLPEFIPDGRGNLMTIHLFSSCPMGENRRKCAADSFGKVHGQANLFIADASLLCTAPGVNPQGSIMAIARRNALHFLQS